MVTQISASNLATHMKFRLEFEERELAKFQQRERWLKYYEKRIKHPADQASHLASWYQLLILGEV